MSARGSGVEGGARSAGRGVCESREQEEEAYALQAAVTSGRVKVLVASIAPSVMHGIGVKGFAPPPPPPAFFRLCSVLDLVVVCCRHDPAVETVAGCAKERATLSRQARDGMRRPMEPTGARANLSHDLLDAPHRSVFHQPHHHQQAQRRVHVTPHAVANSPSFEGETSRLLPIAIQRCCSVNGTESGTRKRPSPRLGSGEPIRALVRRRSLKALGGSLQEVFGRAQASRQQGTTSIRCASLCEQDLDTPFQRVWECQLLEVAKARRVARKKI